MCFKWVSLISISWCLSLTIACSRENVPKERQIKYQTKGSADCVSSISKQLSDYVDGKMGPQEVQGFWNCLDHAVKDFEELTAGDVGRDQYSPNALREFFNEFFIQDYPLGDDLLDSLMDLKRLLLSGSNKMVTRRELSRLRELLTQFKNVSLVLHPHIEIIFGRKADATDEEVRAAVASVRSAIGILGSHISAQKQDYTFGQLQDLVLSVNSFMNRGGNPSETFRKLLTKLQVLPEAKRLLLAGDGRVVGSKDWIHFSDLMGHLFGFYLTYSYSFRENLNGGLSRPLLVDSLDHVTEQLNQSLILHDNGQIPIAEWQNLFDKAYETGAVPPNLKPESMHNALIWMLRRLLGDGVSEPKAVNASHVARLRERLAEWSILHRPPTVLNDPTSTLAKFQSLLQDSVPLQWDNQFRMVFNSVPPVEWSLPNRRQLVFPFLILNWIKESYVGRDVDRLSLEQMEVATSEVLPLIQGFGWMTDAETSLGARRFREADLFTLASNGDRYLDLTEAVRYLGFITSAYVSADHWLKTADNHCGEGRPVECVRKTGFDFTNDLLTPLPGVRTDFAKWGPERFYKYMKDAEITILQEPANGEYSVGTLLQVWQLMEYVEVFMQRFDANRSGTIDLTEALEAYPVYAPTLREMLVDTGATEDEVLAFFTFMMKYGETPFTKFGGVIAFEYWKMHRDSWELNVERDTLMSILSALTKL